MSLPELPDVVGTDLSTLTAKQLREAQETVWDWIQAAESAPADDAPNAETLDRARDYLNAIIAERRDLHSDEPAPRGG